MLLGLPVTLLGVAFYVGLAGAAAMPADKAPRLHQINGLMMIPALGFSAYLANASAELQLVCPFCISIYAGNLLLFWAALKGMKEAGSTLFGDMGTVLTSQSFMIVSGIYVLGVAVGAGAIPEGKKTPAAPISTAKDPAAAVKGLYMSTKNGMDVPLDGLEPVYGPPDAPYQIVEFADFRCGHCAHAFPELHDLVKNSSDVNIKFKNYPLAGQCNPGLESREGGDGVCIAAAGAECAGRQDQFWPFAEQVFFNQNGLAFSYQDFETVATVIGLDVQAWHECMQTGDPMKPVVNDAIAGGVLEIRGTPALFLKGTHGDKWVQVLHTPGDLMRLIEAHRDGVSMPAPPPHSGM